MDNEQQVSTELTRTKEVFLRESPGMSSGPPKLYSVEEEFEKTKRNRSKVVPIVVLAFVVIFGLASTAVTLVIQRSTRQVPIDIDEFNDINLTEILDRQKKNENAFQAAQRQLGVLISEMESRIDAITSEANGAVEIVQNDNISDNLKTSRTNLIRSDEAREISAVRREFEPLIEAKEAEIAEIQAEIDAYDSRQIELAKQNEERLSNQQKLFQIEQEELTDYYENRIDELEIARAQERRDLVNQKDELVALLRRNHANEIRALILRYNPVFEDTRLLSVLNKRIPDIEGGIGDLPAYRATLDAEGVLSRNRFDQIRTRISDLDVLLTGVEQIPYENSIPQTLSQIRSTNRALIAEYEGFWNRLTTVVDAKNEEITGLETTVAARENTISRMEYAVDTRVDIDRENGFVLDPRDPEDMLVRINPDLPVREGDLGYVFRNVDEFIGTVRFVRFPEGFRAALVSLEDSDKPVEPFDKILIKLQ